MARGGARPGAGRKPKTERFEKQIAASDRKAAAYLSEAVEQLIRLAKGGYERVEETWEPAGTVLIDSYVTDEDTGRTTKVKAPAFVGLPATELVLTQRRVSYADADRAANIYLVDRIAGRPVQAQEITSPDNSATVVFYLPQNGRDDADNAEDG